MQRLPLGLGVERGTRPVERHGEVVIGPLEFSERLVRAAAREMELDERLDARALGGREGAVEVRDRLSWRRQSDRMPSGASRIDGRARPISRFPHVVRERLDDRVQRVRVVALEGSRDFPMQRDPLARQQLGVDGLAGERVAEREPFRRFLDDELRGDELLDEREQLLLVAIRERLQQSKVEPPPGDGRRRRDGGRRSADRDRSG